MGILIDAWDSVVGIALQKTACLGFGVDHVLDHHYRDLRPNINLLLRDGPRLIDLCTVPAFRAGSYTDMFVTCQKRWQLVRMSLRLKSKH